MLAHNQTHGHPTILEEPALLWYTAVELRDELFVLNGLEDMRDKVEIRVNCMAL